MATLSSFNVLVDQMRGGVIPSWLPRRLGGGLGQRQKGTQRKLHKDIHGSYMEGIYQSPRCFFLLTSLFAQRLEKATCPT